MSLEAALRYPEVELLGHARVYATASSSYLDDREAFCAALAAKVR